MTNAIKQNWLLLLVLMIFLNCDKENNNPLQAEISSFLNIKNELISSGMYFSYIKSNTVSDPQVFTISGENLSSDIIINTTGQFQLSLNNIDYSSSAIILSNISTEINTVYVRFEPNDATSNNAIGMINIKTEGVDDVSFNLTGKAGNSNIINYLTFNKERVANGGGYSQTSRKTFRLHNNASNIEAIKMYVKLTCPDGGCDEWDVFANVKVKDPVSGEDYELGRFITPYWNDNSQLRRGFEFDVTDFKSILLEEVELRIRTECWNAKGYEVTVDFDYIEGSPDYKYYEIARVLNYDNGSASGIPYGIINHDKDITRQIILPNNTESTHLRTFINGWGEATPSDEGGRRCAEWCYRTHHVKINDVDTFEHDLGPLGCASNPVSNQSPGNWTADRAGWCPGMEVPTRIDVFENSMAGNTFNFEYSLEDWVSDETKDAYYPISTFIVVKSNSQINRPVVID